MQCNRVYLSKNPGDDLLSQGLASQVPSALKSLTSVFGMGTGVASSPSSPGNLLTLISLPVTENYIEPAPLERNFFANHSFE